MSKPLFLATLLAASVAMPGALLATDFNAALAEYKAGYYDKAFDAFEELAREGHSTAQYNLGAMYMTGQGTEKDLVEAWAWTRLAEESDPGRNNDFIRTYEVIAAELTADQLAEAQKRFEQLLNSEP